MLGTFRRTLRVKMFIVVVASLAVVIAAYFAGSFALDGYLTNVYMNSTNTANRSKKKVQSFAAYVSSHSLRSTDAAALNSWQEQHDDVYLMIYNKDNLIFDSGWVVEKRGSSKYVITNSETGETVILLQDSYGTIRRIRHSSGKTTDASPKGAPANAPAANNTAQGGADYNFYPVLFNDGVFDVCIVDYTDDTIRDIGKACMFAFCCVLFVGFIIYYFGREIYRIRRLTNEVANIKDKDIGGRITINGEDEICQLARNIDMMRETIIEQLSREKEAWQANSDLVTAMAHDIRTPLTVMSGYLDLMKNKEYSSKEELDEYIRISYEKSEQLRMLSDKMFRYFYVYSKNGDELTPETFPAEDFLNQMLGEYVVLLGESGYDIRTDMSGKAAEVCVDVQSMKRIMDNVFTNIRKYSDRSRTIDVRVQSDRKNVSIYFRNHINPDTSRAESTHIGTLTCKKLAEEMGGSFSAARRGRLYEAALILPNTLYEPDTGGYKRGFTAILTGGINSRPVKENEADKAR